MDWRREYWGSKEWENDCWKIAGARAYGGEGVKMCRQRWRHEYIAKWKGLMNHYSTQCRK